MTHIGPGAYAARLGVTLEAVRQIAVKHPMPWQPGDKLVDVAAMDAAWGKLYRQGKVKTPAPGQDGDDQESGALEAAKLRRAEAQADLDEMRAQKMRGELVAVTEVDQTWQRIGIALNELFESLPAKLANVLPGDARANQTRIRDVLRTARQTLSERVAVEAAEAEAASAASEEPEPEAEAEVPAPPAKRKRGRPRAQ